MKSTVLVCIVLLSITATGAINAGAGILSLE
jgi:hypothetical protein